MECTCHRLLKICVLCYFFVCLSSCCSRATCSNYFSTLVIWLLCEFFKFCFSCVDSKNSKHFGFEKIYKYSKQFLSISLPFDDLKHRIIVTIFGEVCAKECVQLNLKSTCITTTTTIRFILWKYTQKTAHSKSRRMSIVEQKQKPGELRFSLFFCSNNFLLALCWISVDVLCVECGKLSCIKTWFYHNFTILMRLIFFTISLVSYNEDDKKH
jgi:hypothetical protein